MQADARLTNGFVYRYGEFILNDALRRVPVVQAAAAVHVAASRPIWYDHFVERLQTPRGRFLVVHLINAPLEERLTADAVAPPPATGVRIQLDPALFAGALPRWKEALVLNPDAQSQGQPAIVDGSWVHVPDFPYWSILVVPY
jgi:hypothetical protein